MNLNPLVSIIIPLYNTEKYLAEAIESVLCQSYQNIEVIIVNDGSTDNSLGVARTYEKENVKIFDQPNRGASAARNYGFLQSKGAYVKFFDADDLMNPEMIAAQMNLALRNPEAIISGKWGRFYNNDLGTFKLNSENCWRDMNPIDWICESWKNAQPMTQPGIFLIPRKIIDGAGQWDEHLTLNDDMEFFTKNILKAKCICFSESSILYYRSGLGNIALSAAKSKKAFESNYLSIKLSSSYLLKETNTDLTRRLVANLLQGFVYECYLVNKSLSKKVEIEIALLGGSNYKLPGGKVLSFLSKTVGWKSAKTIHSFLRKSSI